MGFPIISGYFGKLYEKKTGWLLNKCVHACLKIKRNKNENQKKKKIKNVENLKEIENVFLGFCRKTEYPHKSQTFTTKRHLKKLKKKNCLNYKTSYTINENK